MFSFWFLVAGNVCGMPSVPGNSGRSSRKISKGLNFPNPLSSFGFRPRPQKTTRRPKLPDAASRTFNPSSIESAVSVQSKDCVAYDLTVDQYVNPICADSERARIEIVGILAAIDSEV